jgi:hypothetical protein
MWGFRVSALTLVVCIGSCAEIELQSGNGRCPALPQESTSATTVPFGSWGAEVCMVDHIRDCLRDYYFDARVIALRNWLIWRSLGILFTAIWLAVDLWAWLVKQEPTLSIWKWRFVIGWSTTNILLVAAMGGMYWQLNGALADQRQDVEQSLNVKFGSADGNNAFNSVLTLTNESEVDIGRHVVRCLVNMAVLPDGGSIRNSASTLSLKGPLGKDSESLKCFQRMQISPPVTTCADVTIELHYELVPQVGLWQSKRFRFVTRQEREGITWYRQPVNSAGSYCSS